jgi:hypothetical protein
MITNYSDLESYSTVMPPINKVCANECDQQPQVGWDITAQDNEKIAFLFGRKNMEYLSGAITEALEGLDPEGRSIIIPDDKICNVLNSVYRYGTRPNIGDIYTRDIIPPIQDRNDIRDINNQTITIIVSYIRNELEMTANNKTLTVWNTLYGDFNPQGLRAHPIIKLRKRHPQYMAFNMNY